MNFPKDFADFTLSELREYAAMVTNEYEKGLLHGPMGRAVVRDAHQRITERETQIANGIYMPREVLIDSYPSLQKGKTYTIIGYTDSVRVYLTDNRTKVGTFLFIKKRATWEDEKLLLSPDIIAAITDVFSRIDEGEN